MSDKKDKPQTETELTISGKEFGNMVLKAALDKHKKQQSDKVVGSITAILERINVLTRQYDKQGKLLDFCRKQLTAIEAGEFSIRQYDAGIVFNDKEIDMTFSEYANSIPE